MEIKTSFKNKEPKVGVVFKDLNFKVIVLTSLEKFDLMMEEYLSSKSSIFNRN